MDSAVLFVLVEYTFGADEMEEGVAVFRVLFSVIRCGSPLVVCRLSQDFILSGTGRKEILMF